MSELWEIVRLCSTWSALYKVSVRLFLLFLLLWTLLFVTSWVIGSGAITWRDLALLSL